MLIDINLLKKYSKSIGIRGICHIGANTCQELGFYINDLNINPENIVWIEAIPFIVDSMKRQGIKNMYQVVLDEIPGEVEFNITNNNGESSSILELNTHLLHHPHVQVSQKMHLKTQTFQNFVDNNNLPTESLDFLVMDIQGAELRVLRGAQNLLKDVKMICTEINTEELYKGAGLFNELTKFLEEYNFVCINSVVNEHKWGDALYIRKEYVLNY